MMTPDLWLALGGLFVSVALLTGLGASVFLAHRSPERRRLREMATAGGPGFSAGGPGLSFGVAEQFQLTERLDPRLERIAKSIPKSPKEMSRLRRRLAEDGSSPWGISVSTWRSAPGEGRGVR